MISLLLAAIVQLPEAEEARRAAAYARLPVATCDTVTTPRDAIWSAAEAGGRPVPGCYALTVAAVGHDGRDAYLNSERDYRDPRSLNVRISRRAERDLADRVGAAFDDALIGRTLLVRGSVVRQRIDITGGGRPTGKYYYQTHLLVDDAAQVGRPQP